MINKPFAGLYKFLTIRTKRDAISLAVLAVTAWLVHGGHLGDAAYVGVVPVILTHMYLSHQERLVDPPAATTTISALVTNIKGQL